jgi:hypothetical protein
MISHFLTSSAFNYPRVRKPYISDYLHIRDVSDSLPKIWTSLKGFRTMEQKTPDIAEFSSILTGNFVWVCSH